MKKSNLRVGLFLLGAAFTCLAPATTMMARAATVSYAISGQFKLTPPPDPWSGAYPGDVLPGLLNDPTFTGLLTYDTSATETSPGVFDPSSVSITLSLDGIGTLGRTGAGAGDDLELIDGTPGNNPDIFRAEKKGAVDPATDFDPNILVTRLTIDAIDVSGLLAPAAFSAVDPSTPSYQRFLFLGLRGPSYFPSNEGEIVDTQITTTITLTAVPEPGSLALMGISGVLSTLAVARRSRKLSSAA